MVTVRWSIIPPNNSTINLMTNVVNNSVIGPLIKGSSMRTYAKGQTIVFPQDASSQLYVIKEGAITMETSGKDGERKILYILGPSTLFPMVSFTEDSVSTSWFYVAHMTTTVYVIPYEKLAKRLTEVDGFTAYNELLKQMLVEVHELLLKLSDQSKTDSSEKLVSVLLFLYAYHTKKVSGLWQPVRFAVTHQFLADMTGLTRETVSLTMKELAGKRLVRYKEKGKLELHAANLTKQQHV